MIYLDYTATTPVDEDVLNTYIKTETTFFGNPNALHKFGQASNHLINKATSEILNILNLNHHNIVYTTNATEANNLGIYGIVLKHKTGKVITTKIEHPSVYDVFKDLETKGYEVIYLDVDESGIINLNQLEKELDKDTIFVSIMWVNNIVGTIEPIDKVIRFVANYPKAKLHVDAVQGITKILPNFSFKDIDLITISGHKLYAPKGIGALIYKNNLELEKRLFGAKNQYGIKPGTMSPGLVASLAKAIKKFYPRTLEDYDYVNELRNYLRSELEKFDFIHINSPKAASPYIMSISIPSMNGETIVHLLEQNEIYVSTGSACSSKEKKPEKTVYNMTKNDLLSKTTIRISLSHLTSIEDLKTLIEVLKKVNNII